MGLGLCLALTAAGWSAGVNPETATRFVRNYQALESRPVSLWERILYSYVLASDQCSRTRSKG